MTNAPDDPFEELLRDVDTPTPLDPSFDERLWAELDASLHRPPTSFAIDEEAGDDLAHPPQVIEVESWTTTPRARSLWLVAAAALLLVAGAASISLLSWNRGSDVVATDGPTTTISPTAQLREACATFRTETQLDGTALGDLSSALAGGTVAESELRNHLGGLDVPLADFGQAVEEIHTDDNADDMAQVFAELDRIMSWIDQVLALASPVDVDETSFLLTRLSWSILAANQPLASLGAGGCLR